MWGSEYGRENILSVGHRRCGVCIVRDAFSGPFQIFFDRFLASGRLPKKLKERFVCPMDKSGSRADAKNYKPIFLTLHISKIMERIDRKKVITLRE